MRKYENADHIDADLYEERFAELLEIVQRYGKPDSEKWLRDWVLTYQQRLCDVPVDLFPSQDGFAEVEYVLREFLEDEDWLNMPSPDPDLDLSSR